MVEHSDAADRDEGSGGYLVPRSTRQLQRADASPFRLAPRLIQAADQLIPLTGNGSRVGAVAIALQMHDRDISVRGLSAYLGFADRVYGRFTSGSLKRYRRSKSQLRIAEVRNGSLILFLREAIGAVSFAQGLALTALVLKYLPGVIKAPAAAYRDYEEGRFRRAERKRLTQRAESDAVLERLAKYDFRQVINAMLDAYEAEESRLPPAQDFAIRAIDDVRIEVVEARRPQKPRNTETTHHPGPPTKSVRQKRRKGK